MQEDELDAAGCGARVALGIGDGGVQLGVEGLFRVRVLVVAAASSALLVEAGYTFM